jgi:hypothetical protein
LLAATKPGARVCAHTSSVSRSHAVARDTQGPLDLYGGECASVADHARRLALLTADDDTIRAFDISSSNREAHGRRVVAVLYIMMYI